MIELKPDIDECLRKGLKIAVYFHARVVDVQFCISQFSFKNVDVTVKFYFLVY